MIDTPETLAAALLRAAAQASVEARGVIQRGALNIKNEAKRNVAASAPSHNANAAGAITYDTHAGGGTLTPGAEIGYDKDRRPGRLGNLLEYGSRNNPPHRDLGRALDSEEPRFIEALSAITERLL